MNKMNIDISATYSFAVVVTGAFTAIKLEQGFLVIAGGYVLKMWLYLWWIIYRHARSSVLQ